MNIKQIKFEIKKQEGIKKWLLEKVMGSTKIPTMITRKIGTNIVV
tara:strand:- start:5311 stop:5445 length:135 start_codon:yes stop_codon:yes gene_type:complete